MTNESPWTTLLPLADLPVGRPTPITAANRTLALIRLPDHTIYALDDACPHAGASLSAGYLHHRCLTCPMHGWAFDLPTGRMTDSLTLHVPTYATRIHEGQVQADLSHPLPLAPLPPPAD